MAKEWQVESYSNEVCELGAGKENRKGRKAEANGKLVEYGTVNVYNLISA